MIVGGIAAVVGTGGVGGGLKFVWNKVETRFQQIEAKLENCESRERVADRRGAINLAVIEIVCAEVERLSPVKPNPVLLRARAMLEGLKLDVPGVVLPTQVPKPDPYLTALAERLDRQQP